MTKQSNHVTQENLRLKIWGRFFLKAFLFGDDKLNNLKVNQIPPVLPTLPVTSQSFATS